jgi:60 kDa SS-A/Ro ribonucleoprotein
MKDMPAVLAALVACQDPELLSKIFDKTINNPKMMRNFVQIIRSGVTGRKSLGTRPKKLVQEFLSSLSNEALFNADVGNDPSLQDVIKLVHPKPDDKYRAALYSYLLDREYVSHDLPHIATQYESFKKDMDSDLPGRVDFQKLTALPLKDKHWNKIAEHASWDQTRRNLNTFARHGVFNDKKMVDLVAARLENEELVKKSHVLPYNLFTTFQNIDNTIPTKISIALQKAAEIALSNIPEYKGDVYVMVDTSGSMSMNPVTGKRGTATTKTYCIHVAALFAAAIMKKNPTAEIMPFSTKVHKAKLNPMDSIMTNAEKLAALGGGGTNCAAPLEVLNDQKVSNKEAVVIMISDNESWHADRSYKMGTNLANEWSKFKSRNPRAKLICIDITPNTTAQITNQKDVLNLGGFSDMCFGIIDKFVEFGNDKDLWVKTIESVEP